MVCFESATPPCATVPVVPEGNHIIIILITYYAATPALDVTLKKVILWRYESEVSHYQARTVSL